MNLWFLQMLRGEEFDYENSSINVMAVYFTVQNINDLLEKGQIHFTATDFPTNEEELPYKLFKNNFIKLEEELSQARFNSSHFISKTRLYLENNEEILKQYSEIGKHMTFWWMMLKSLMTVTKLEDYGKHMRALSKKREEVKELIKIFEDKLVDTKIRSIPV